MIVVVNLPGEAATKALAQRLAASAARGDVIALRGDLGAGKTTFARAFIRARLGHDEDVPSPTFTLVQLYEALGAAIWHFDLYRLAAPEDAWELGIEEAFASGISLIEWPDRLAENLPASRLDVTLEFADRPEARRAIVCGGAVWDDRLVELAANV